MRKIMLVLALVMVLAVAFAAIGGTAHAAPNDKACWGQASKVFAKMGKMGEHASAYDTPRDGLRNLARELAKSGIIPDDSMQSLGVFVATDLGLTVEACGVGVP